jgi:methyl-accepting chemotaxis protein
MKDKGDSLGGEDSDEVAGRLDANGNAIESSQLEPLKASQKFQHLIQEHLTSKGDTRREFGPETRAEKLNRLTLQVQELQSELSLGPEEPAKDLTEKLLGKAKELEQVLEQMAPAQTRKHDFERLVNKLSLSPSDTSSASREPLVPLSKPKPSNEDIQLSRRLEKLEALLGVSMHQTYDNSTRPSGPLVQTVSKLESQFEFLLDSEVQDRLSARLKALSELSKNNRDLLKADDRIDKVYRSLNDSSLSLLPDVVARLKTLQGTHDSAIHLNQAFSTLQNQSQKDSQSLEESKKALKDLEKSLNENAQGIKTNFEALQSRLESFTSRLEALEKLKS